MRLQSSAEDDAAKVTEAGLHMILDMNGYAEGERPDLVARPPSRRLAPVTAIFHGYEGTYGGGPSLFDHIISDPVIAPPENAAPPPPTHVWASRNASMASPGGGGMFSETLLLLPVCKFPGGDLAPGVQMEDRAPTARSEFKSLLFPGGAGARPFVFCCFAKLYKVQPRVAEAWFDILRRAPNSVMWLLAYTEATPEAQQCFRRHATAAGIDPSRIVFTPLVAREQALIVKSHANLLLDTTPYNGHMTVPQSHAHVLRDITCIFLGFCDHRVR